MDRRACADLPALALQLLAAAHPEWRDLPAAVVDIDEPTGTLQWVNRQAWRAGLRRGMRYASALALDGRLRAGTVADTAVADAVEDLAVLLRTFTPHVEPSVEEAGVFWLDASGLESLYPSLEAWGRSIVRAIEARGLEVRLVVGFTRFGTCALARTSRRLLVCQGQEEERRLVREVPLERLGIEPGLRDALLRLGVRRVGDFLDLPAEGIRRRFGRLGEEAWRLHRRARGQDFDPLVPLAPRVRHHRRLVLEDPVFDTGIVLFVVRGLLVDLLGPLADTGQAARSVTVTLHRSLRRDVAALTLTVRTAEPTLEEAVLTDLLRLRLDAATRRELAGSSVAEIEVEVEAAAADREQLRLFHERTRRDLAAASRAIARLRAELGEDKVVRAVLRQGHLPEASYAWEPVEKVEAPSPRLVLTRPLVRRIQQRAVALPPRPFRERDDCWIPPTVVEEPRRADRRSSPRTRGTHGVGANTHGRVEEMTSPYIVSGGWWNREVHREYHYAHTEDGEILWVYYDRRRRRWFLAGQVE